MKNFLIIVLILMISSRLKSQEILLEKEVKLRSFFLAKDKKESLPIVNIENKEIGMFLLDRKEIRSFIFDMDYVFKDSITVTRPASKFETLLGSTYQNNNYTLLFTNSHKTKFLAKSINFLKKESELNELEIKLKKEDFLESFSYKNMLYLITMERGESILNIYEIKENKIARTGKIDLTGQKFTKAFKSLDYVLTHTTSAIREDIILNKIDNNNPNSIDLASYANKIYCYNNTIYITMDIYNDYTKLISIDLNNFESKVTDYPIAKVDCEYDLGIKSNSYLLDNKIYQVSGCKNELYFSISDILTTTKLKEKKVNKNDSIDFKNTPLIQLGGAFNKNKKYKELNETEEILKKIETGNIGISAYHSKSNIEITIGGYKKMVTKELLTSAATVGIGAGITTSSAATVGPSNTNYYYSPTMYSYQTYSYARSVYFKSLLNQNLENITGSLNDNAFDKIRKYINENEKDISTETIFKVNDYYVLGYFNKKEEKYYLLKFVD